MDKNLITTFILIIFFLGGLMYFAQKQVEYENSINSTNSFNNSCNITKTLKIINGDSMAPQLRNGDEVILLENYYNCNDVKINDIVAYDYAGSDNPVIKIVKATDKDKVELKGNLLYINDKVMTNSVGEKYVFTKRDITMLALYVKDDKIPQNSFFVFGDNIASSSDSRKFGAISKNDFLGKFVIN